MRRRLLLGLGLGLLNGGLTLVLGWWLGRRPSTFGWYAYSPMPRRYADYLPAPTTRPAWEISLVVLAAFVIVNAGATAAWFYLQRRRPA